MVNHPRRSRRKVSATITAHDHDLDYATLLTGVHISFNAAIIDQNRVFETDAAGLYDLYIRMLPDEKQTHTCNACRRFIENFGHIVTIADDGSLIPAMWGAPGCDFYRPAFTAMFERVAKARVIGVYLSKDRTWGQPRTGNYTHMSVTIPSEMVYRERLLTPFQAMAAAKENFRTVVTALSEFTISMLDEAVRILSADVLARSERFLAPVKWLRGLHDRPKGKRGEAVMWKAIALAPEGYCHPKASVIGPLLDDIAIGLPFAEIKARFDAKMHPLQYQRPQAAPSLGNIKAGEAVIAKLGLERSLERRFARLGECETLWLPRVAQPAVYGGGVFSHLKAKDADDGVRPVNLPSVTMTWEKFRRTVLSDAEKIELNVPAHGNFSALLTAEHADTAQILKWSNPVSWYVYNGGSHAGNWALTAGRWTAITGIVPSPALWGDSPKPYLGGGTVLVLSGAVDQSSGQGNALFPENLIEDLHSIRATIEAYSKSAIIGGKESASACGLMITSKSADCQLRAFVNGAWNGYHIDRWD